MILTAKDDILMEEYTGLTGVFFCKKLFSI